MNQQISKRLLWKLLKNRWNSGSVDLVCGIILFTRKRTLEFTCMNQFYASNSLHEKRVFFELLPFSYLLANAEISLGILGNLKIIWISYDNRLSENEKSVNNL